MSLHKVTELPHLPPRPVDAHKGTFGRVLIVGGCRGMSGGGVPGRFGSPAWWGRFGFPGCSAGHSGRGGCAGAVLFNSFTGRKRPGEA